VGVESAPRSASAAADLVDEIMLVANWVDKRKGNWSVGEEMLFELWGQDIKVVFPYLV